MLDVGFGCCFESVDGGVDVGIDDFGGIGVEDNWCRDVDDV